ncbi:MAG: ACT domain-containing protein [Oscillospiraceae bacterium]|nr:ACT domain-containing protein [Oscillospiraceae bacterium]
MKAIVTVIGKDRVGIIASVCTLLAQYNVNILNISQSIMQENFVMVMLVDIIGCKIPLVELSEQLAGLGAEGGLSIRIQREDIFDNMHRI